MKDGFGFGDGLFSGYNADTGSYDKSSWDYELDEQGFAKADDTWQHPRCVINLLPPACGPVHTGNRFAHLRHTAGQILRSVSCSPAPPRPTKP